MFFSFKNEPSVLDRLLDEVGPPPEEGRKAYNEWLDRRGRVIAGLLSYGSKDWREFICLDVRCFDKCGHPLQTRRDLFIPPWNRLMRPYREGAVCRCRKGILRFFCIDQ